jgi:nucleotide-binding universal stress UspA family protein
MLSANRLLVPVDFSERSAAAARYAKTFGSHFHSQMTLLHVLPPAHYPAVPLMEAGATMRDALFAARASEVQKELDSFLAEEFPDTDVTRIVLEGDPAPTIVDYAHSEKVDLIAMPTHGYGPFRRFLLGSVAAKVLHDADCPVLTGVHLEEAPPADSIHSGEILCAVGLGPQSGGVLAWAARAAGEFDARLTLVHAIPRLEAYNGEYFDPNWRTLLANIAAEQIEKLQQSVGTRAEVFIEDGDIARVVRCAALRRRAALLVIGRGSAEGIIGRLRTHSYAILRESPCPVVSV